MKTESTRTRWWRAGWGLMTLLSLGIAGYAFLLLFSPAARPPFLAESPYPWALLAHFDGGGTALALGPWQFLTGPRQTRSSWHRWTGRVYAVAVAVAGTASLLLSTVSMGGMVGHAGFFFLGVFWLTSTAIAVRYARAGKIPLHRQWMVRSFALTFAAVTLRLQIPISQMMGIPFDSAYIAIAWLAWVPNLLVAEWMVRRSTS